MEKNSDSRREVSEESSHIIGSCITDGKIESSNCDEPSSNGSGSSQKVEAVIPINLLPTDDDLQLGSTKNSKYSGRALRLMIALNGAKKFISYKFVVTETKLGIYDDLKVRAAYWMILLNYLPLRRDQWDAVTNKLRGNYASFLNDVINEPITKYFWYSLRLHYLNAIHRINNELKSINDCCCVNCLHIKTAISAVEKMLVAITKVQEEEIDRIASSLPNLSGQIAKDIYRTQQSMHWFTGQPGYFQAFGDYNTIKYPNIMKNHFNEDDEFSRVNCYACDLSSSSNNLNDSAANSTSSLSINDNSGCIFSHNAQNVIQIIDNKFTSDWWKCEIPENEKREEKKIIENKEQEEEEDEEENFENKEQRVIFTDMMSEEKDYFYLKHNKMFSGILNDKEETLLNYIKKTIHYDENTAEEVKKLKLEKKDLITEKLKNTQEYSEVKGPKKTKSSYYHFETKNDKKCPKNEKYYSLTDKEKIEWKKAYNSAYVLKATNIGITGKFNTYDYTRYLDLNSLNLKTIYELGIELIGPIYEDKTLEENITIWQDNLFQNIYNKLLKIAKTVLAKMVKHGGYNKKTFLFTAISTEKDKNGNDIYFYSKDKDEDEENNEATQPIKSICNSNNENERVVEIPYCKDVTFSLRDILDEWITVDFNKLPDTLFDGPFAGLLPKPFDTWRLSAMFRNLVVLSRNTCVDGIYTQGQNELCAIIMFTLGTQNPIPSYSRPFNIEADTSMVYYNLYTKMNDVFCSDVDSATSGLIGILNRCDKFIQTFLPPTITAVLRKYNLTTHFYAISWITSLFSQQFELPPTLQFWDSIIAHMSCPFANDREMPDDYIPHQGAFEKYYDEEQERDNNFSESDKIQKTKEEKERLHQKISAKVIEVHKETVEIMDKKERRKILPVIPTDYLPISEIARCNDFWSIKPLDFVLCVCAAVVYRVFIKKFPVLCRPIDPNSKPAKIPNSSVIMSALNEVPKTFSDNAGDYSFVMKAAKVYYREYIHYVRYRIFATPIYPTTYFNNSKNAGSKDGNK